MDKLHPDIRNLLHAQLNSGSDKVVHAHHLPRITEDLDETPQQDKSTDVEERTALPEKGTSRTKELFRTSLRAIQNLRRQGYDPAET